MNTTAQPIARGNHNGTPWQSLTHLHEARTTLLEWELKKYNVYRKEIDLLAMDHAAFLKHRYDLTLDKWLNKPLCDRERLLFYKIRSKYFNNYPIK